MLGSILQRSLTKGKNVKSISKMTNMGFRSTVAMSKKLGIGDAADILEQKISGISQIVSRYSLIYFRTILRNSVKSFHLVMVLQEYSDLLKYNAEKWLSSHQESKVWP